LKRYKEREGHCRAPQRHKEDGFALGVWVSNQRKDKDDLPINRRKKLDGLGFVWHSFETDWEEGFSYLKMYKDREGHCRVPQKHKENGFALGSWVSDVRGGNIKLSVEQRQRLDALGFVWNSLEADWSEGFNYLKTYKGREGHCRVPQSYRENGFRLGGWVSLQRGNRDRMSAERRQQLDTLGFIWAALPNKWEEGFSRLKAYKEREGDCRVRALHVENGFRLGSWVGVQRGNRHRMSGERRQRLDKLGFVWDILRYQWGEGFSYLQAFKKREGHCRVAALHIENGFRLGSWVSLQRGNKDKMSAEQRQRLDTLGFVWGFWSSQWEKGFSCLENYMKREGHCRVPALHIENGFRLGQWVGVQRAHRNKLDVQNRERLDQLGFVWDVLSSQWEDGLSYLHSYKDREGHCRVPYNHIENGFRLGQWVVVQRQRNKDALLPPERRTRLSKLGFVWDVFSSQWEEGFSFLKAYKRREGHCRVPQSYSERGFRLGQWVAVQRRQKDTMPTDRRRYLTKLGFVWKVQ
jgi:hypothetical protein